MIIESATIAAQTRDIIMAVLPLRLLMATTSGDAGIVDFRIVVPTEFDSHLTLADLST